jgi:hypothetical protein
MRNWMWSLLVFVVTGVLIWVLNLSFVMTMVVLIPVLIYVFIFGSFMYSFRDSLKPQPIPARGYESRIRETEQKMGELSRDFREIDRFYLKAIPDSTTVAFLHDHEPVFCCLYHFGKKMGCDVVTLYENDFGLTTNNSLDAGMTPRREKDLIQIFPRAGYQQLYEKHMAAHIFLIEKGLRPRYLHPQEFRHHFMQDYRAQGEYIRAYPFWPAMLLFRTVSQYGKKYCLPVPEQFEKGMMKIFNV